MAELDIALGLIQLIALFLPAWAIMVQITVRFLRRVNLSEQPLLIPIFAVGFSVAFGSVWLFTGATVDIIAFFINAGLIEPDSSLVPAVEKIGLGSLAFLTLGVLVIFGAIFQDVDFWDMGHILLVGTIFFIIAGVSWRLRFAPIAMGGGLLVFVVDWGYIVWREKRGGVELPFGPKKDDLERTRPE